MPNWCVGTLKVRGEKENIKRFLSYGLERSMENNVEEDEYSITVNSKGSFYINGTHRNFIQSDCITWDFDSSVLVIEDFEAAWGIEVEALAKVSQEYALDFKIYVYERGMEFNLDIEIHKGAIIKNDQITFTDYSWECAEPQRGG
jgi:hypothetical protein